MNSLKRNYFPEIDGLRAFAVIAVIVNHFNNDALPSGAHTRAMTSLSMTYGLTTTRLIPIEEEKNRNAMDGCK